MPHKNRRLYLEKNKDKLRLKWGEYYRINAPRLNALNALWRRSNPKKIALYAETRRKWNKAHPEKVKAAWKRYYKDNKDDLLLKVKEKRRQFPQRYEFIKRRYALSKEQAKLK